MDVQEANSAGLGDSSPCGPSGPLRFVKKGFEIDADRSTLHFSEVIESCCLFTGLDGSVADYVFIPYSDSMFRWNGSHFTMALAWNVRLMDCLMAGGN